MVSGKVSAKNINGLSSLPVLENSINFPLAKTSGSFLRMREIINCF